MNNPTQSNPAQTDIFLFEHFATLATAPEGIARLRELILQLAVQGKLGTQDAGDEPASVLLKRIEKERMASEGKTKKEKSLDPVKDNDVGFQIPDTWVLTRLGNIAQYNAETKTSSNDISDDAWVFDLEDIEKDTSRILQKVRFKDRRSLSTKSRFRKGDILYGKLRPYLNKVVVADEDGYCTTEIVPIRPYGKIFPTFLMYALKTPDFLSYVNSKTYGIKMPRLGTADALNTIIPLPPLPEQHRIVAKVDRLMALCDELEARQQQERAGCLKLGTASLAGLQNATHPEEFGRQWAQVCDAFEMIFDGPENVAVLRQTILQLAVQGRLVRQEPGDEPAEKLVERIRKEKERLIKEGALKMEKPLEPINEEECPFALPDGWAWVRINDAAKIVEYGTSEKALSSPNAYGRNSVPVFRMNNIQNGKVSHEDLKYVSNSIEELPHLYLQNNDILINRTNSYELVGKAGIFKGEDNKFTFASYLIRISFFPQFVNAVFINTALNAEYFRKSQIEPQVTQQCGQANFSGSKIKNALVPLPPLAEQHRIVAKVDALMALCDALESRLKDRAGGQGRLVGAVVRQVAG